MNWVDSAISSANDVPIGASYPAYRSIILKVSLTIIGAMALLWPALDNGYPLLMFGDTIAYAKGPMEPSYFKSPLYSYLIWCFGAGLGLWWLLFTQSCVVSYLFLLMAQTLWREKWLTGYLLLLFMTLTCTSLPFTCSTLHPDVFAFTMVGSCFYAMTTGNGVKRWSMFLLYFISITSHYSHFLIALCLVPFIAYLIFQRKIVPHAGKCIVAATLFPLLMTVVVTFSPARKTGIYYPMGAFHESGMLEQHLSEYCGKKRYLLCQFRPGPPYKSASFIYRKGSLWQNPRSHGYSEAEVVSDFRKIAWDILKHNWDTVALVSLRRWIEQLFRVDTLYHLGEPKNLELESTLKGTLLSFNAYISSHQHTHNLSYPLMNNFILKFQKTFYIGFLVCLLLWSVFKGRSPFTLTHQNTLVYVVGAALISNAFVCGVISTVASRYQVRVAWYGVALFPWLLWQLFPMMQNIMPNRLRLLSENDNT